MQAAEIWPSKRSCRILLSYNLPFLFWTAAALLYAHGLLPSGGCIVKSLLGFCSGCGLTRDLAALLTAHAPHGQLIYPVLAGFLINLFISLRLSRRA